ncbi:hypothetical protein [Gimesia panareensis]|uniref:hypothetical protein n=1 Tax=Gimesia panareensis TaxID=2527978 RepID=UPI00119F270C|nr:hypothetical protein [Gimesia panareensis]
MKTGLRELSLGEVIDQHLAYRCNVSALQCYTSSETGGPLPASWDADSAPEIVPLWECDLSLLALRDEEFVEIDYEALEDLTVIARSEQGMFAYLFFYLIEDLGGSQCFKQGNQEYDSLLRLNSQLRFEHLEDILNFQRQYGSEINCRDLLLNYTRSIP